MAKIDSAAAAFRSSDLALMDYQGLLAWTVRILFIASEILTLEEPEAIAGRVLDALVQELGLPVVSILLADGAGVLGYAAAHGVSDEVKALGFRQEGRAYGAYRSGQATFTEDAGSDPNTNPLTRHLIGAFAALPIQHRGRSYGVVLVTFREPHGFPPIERAILAAYADQMAIALDNGRLHRQERHRIAFLSAQADLAEALSTTLERASVVRILGETLRNTALALGVAVWTEQNRVLSLGWHAGFPAEGALKAGVPADASGIMAALNGDLVAQVPLEALEADLGVTGLVAGEAHRVFAMPLQCAGNLEGLLVFLAHPNSFDPPLVQAMGERAALALHNARLYESSQAAASLDPLTGLLNRRAFAQSARSMVAVAARTGVPLALIMLDADHFKACNDTYGHPVGDKVLVLLAQVLRAQVRPNDLAARIGGEEFAVVLQGAAQEAALKVAERIRLAMAGAFLDLGEGQRIPVPTISLGLAELSALTDPNLECLLERADAALYRAKGEGRNRTCLA
jgi:diguanylate cyclase (GGDEF)-like protein